MNFEESNAFMEEEIRRSKKKKVVMGFMIVCLLLILTIFFLIFMIQYQDSQTLKLFIDGKQIDPISSTLLRQEDDVVYVNVRELGEKIRI